MLCTLKITLAPSFLTTSTTASAALPQRAPKMGKIFQIILYYKILQNMYLSIYEDSFGSNILRVCSCALSIPTPRAIILILFWLWIPNIHRSLQIGTVLVFFIHLCYMYTTLIVFLSNLQEELYFDCACHLMYDVLNLPSI